MEQIPNEGYEEMVKNQVQLLIPDMEQVEDASEAAQDAYTAVTDGDKDRMCYVTGKRAKELYAKRQEMGGEGFRRYVRNALMQKEEKYTLENAETIGLGNRSYRLVDLDD